MDTLESKDLFGKAISDFWNKSFNSPLLVHADLLEEDEFPVPYLFRSAKEWPLLEKLAVETCRGDILEIGAGAGSHALYLQEQGQKVTALDISVKACEVAEQRGVENVICSDYKKHQGKYDTILFVMNGIGIGGNLEGSKDVLAWLKMNLKEGGQVIFDSSDIKYMYEDDEGGYWIDLNAEYYGALQYQFEYKGEKEAPFDWLYIDPEKMNELAEEAGFEMEIIKEGDHYDYLARLTVKN